MSRLHKNDPNLTHAFLATLVRDLRVTQSKLASAYTAQDAAALSDELHRALGGVVYLKLPQLEQALIACYQTVETDTYDQKALEAAYTDLQQACKPFCKSGKAGLPS